MEKDNVHEASLSEWSCLEVQLKTSVTELTKEKRDLIVKLDTLQKELKVSKSQLSKIEAEFMENKETVCCY